MGCAMTISKPEQPMNKVGTLFNVVIEGVTTNDYYTPKWIFDAIDLEFDLDVAAPVHGIPWIPAKKWFSQKDDGLAQNWGDALVWMNPPFSNVTPWAHKFMVHNNGLALMPLVRSKWLMKMWDMPNALITLCPTDLRFCTPEGKEKTISYQTFLIAMGDKATDALRRTKLARVR